LRNEFPKEQQTQGGILADDMGLGKTIEILALIHSNRFNASTTSSADLGSSHATLIVCPLNLIGQWRDEVERCFKNMSVEIYYGDEKRKTFSKSSDPMIVITTYGTLASEHSSNNRSNGLFSCHWHRVVLDEAHYIKEKGTKAAKACYALSASNRWCVTGTPVVNQLDDLYSLVRFLKVAPWSSYAFWSSFITQAFEKGDPQALEIVQTILEPILMRRTKTMKDKSGNPIIVVPEKIIKTEVLNFNAQELELYLTINNFSKRRLEDLQKQGKADYIHVFALLLRLRQMCDHYSLVNMNGASDETEILLDEILKKHNVSSESQFSMQLQANLKSQERECPVCFNTSNCLLPCLHMICRSCIEDMSERNQENNFCPVCMEPVSDNDIMQVLSGPEEDQADVKIMPLSCAPSSKLSRLLESLTTLQRSKPDDKIIIFSQWTSMLDIIESAIKSEKGLGYIRIDGTLSQKKREHAIHAFKEDSSVRILLASLRSTGVGLNLTVANHVFLFEPYWNLSVENQAIDRVHRMGQTKTVFVTKYIIRNSIEEKILLIQERKAALAGALTSSNKEEARDSLETLMTLI
jgi:DNA repair protein RAD5